MKKGVLIIVILSLAIIIPLVSAGFSDWFKENIMQSPQNFSVTVGNAVPIVTIIDNPGTIDLNPATTTPVSINFTAADNNGIADLNDTTLAIAFDYDLGGEIQRTGTIADCTTSVVDSNTKRYQCNIIMQFYDASGTWDITISIDDIAGPVTGTNSAESFTVAQLKAISLTPATVGFGTVSPGDSDTIGQDTQVQNDGNYNVPGGGLTITAQNLTGEITSTEYIPAINFNSANKSVATVCSTGTTLAENLATAIPAFALSKGNPTTTLPTNNITHCLTLVPLGLSDQVYSTIGGIAWEFTI